jgi:hypothetical protein
MSSLAPTHVILGLVPRIHPAPVMDSRHKAKNDTQTHRPLMSSWTPTHVILGLVPRIRTAPVMEFATLILIALTRWILGIKPRMTHKHTDPLLSSLALTTVILGLVPRIHPTPDLTHASTSATMPLYIEQHYREGAT